MMSIPVMRLHRLIIKSSLAVSTVKNLSKPQTQEKKEKKNKNLEKHNSNPVESSIIFYHHKHAYSKLKNKNVTCSLNIYTNKMVAVVWIDC